MRIGSLFSGIGGLDLAVHAVFGGEPVYFCEREPWCRLVLAKHWPDATISADVTGFCPPNVDLICGGFPCQDVSHMGSGLGLNGERSGLWHHFARIIRETRPSIVVIENVANLAKRGLAVVLGDLASLGFDAEWCTVRAADAGLPHGRARLFVLAYTDTKGRGLIRTAHNDDRDHASRDYVDGRRSSMVPPPPGPTEDAAWYRRLEQGFCEPGVLGIVDEPSRRLDTYRRRKRLAACGNACSPAQAEYALRIMIDRVCLAGNV